MKFDKDNSIFLIGGHDLEMDTIVEIFKKNKIKYIDNKLHWGAKLSEYKDEFEKHHYMTIYGIELETDLDNEYLSKYNYTLIDHHGESSHKPSAIEQIANLINIILNEYQILVALNDCGGPRRMLEYFNKPIVALSDEKLDLIKKIRNADLAFQGIAEPSLLVMSELQHINNIGYKKNNDILIVPSASGKFGASFDAMYLYHDDKEALLEYQYIIVYSDNEACLYFPKEKSDLMDKITIHPKESLESYRGSTFLGFFKKDVSNFDVEIAINRLEEIADDIK